MVHSKSDWRLLASGYGSLNKPGYRGHRPRPVRPVREPIPRRRPSRRPGRDLGSQDGAPAQRWSNLLFFGLIRPYKGLDDLLRVFNELSGEEAARLWLTVVGETWEGGTEPERLIKTSPHSDRITFVNEYVPDEVVAAAFAHADVVVLPYRRSWTGGILHVAMNQGLPIVVPTRVGGLPEAADGYDGDRIRSNRTIRPS